MEPRKRLYYILLSIFLVVMIGSCGYYIIFGGSANFLDCIYMTVVSITTVGYGEILQITGNTTAEIFTMFLITFGMGVLLYGLSTLTASLIEVDISGILRKKKMVKEISKLTNHFIVCGGGETGRGVLDELVKSDQDVVLIETEEDMIERCQSIVDHLLFIQGDATEDDNLINAGIERAAGIIVSLPSDKDNLYITMTARMLNNNIRIISRMINQQLEPKLKKAGADKVVSPNAIGALRMASEMIRPTVVDFIDSMLRTSSKNIRINQLTISEDSPASGKDIRACGFKEEFGLLILGYKDRDGDIEFNPMPHHVLTPGMTLVVMGEVQDVSRAREAF
ncbi:MAG: potassium channel protein [Deltaproteobacteria bacterium]|jgi:voltage-gated potassium channel|nr:potassium channel protein [Deltaproteobacteria bacterium]